MTDLSKKHYKITGLIIRKRHFFETDKIIYIFSKERGILQANVRSARKSTSKLSGLTELFTYGHFEIVKGKNLDILISAKPIRHFEKATKDLEKISDYYIICEIIQKLLPEMVENQKIFYETLSIFEFLNEKESKPTVFYIYKLIVLLGYGLDLRQCCMCKRIPKESKRRYLSFEDGSLLCENCANGNGQKMITPEEIKILDFIQSSDFEKYSRLKMPNIIREGITNLIFGYLEHIYQKEFKSRRFSNDLKKLSRNTKK